MRIITSGARYLDIDAYAGIIAYAELLQKQGEKAVAVSTSPMNESISRTVRSWNAPLLTTYQSAEGDTFTLIDVSEPEFFDSIVDVNHVDEILDHHLGFEAYWQERLGDKAQIEFIGAACTLVFEDWKRAGIVDQMSETSARLLVCGILDNTLNFGAQVTTDRDREAYATLLEKANLPDDWTAQYFTECQSTIIEDISRAVRNDMKALSFSSFNQPVAFGQLVVWDGPEILAHHQGNFKHILEEKSPAWFMNVISIREGKSYFITDNMNLQKWLSNLLALHFVGEQAAARRVWLRKEVIKRDLLK